MSRVLVVEDHPMNRMLVRELLEHRGHEVAEACDVEEARGALTRGAPDIVLLDIQIPGGGGPAVLDFIRASPALRALPVVAVTAQAMTGDRERFLAAGFDGYVSKPIDTRSFCATIEGFLRIERSEV
ncbi:MAG: response regulator [Labilithrix sp.]|nr:response regulator [Labilithrix sp.]MCW5812505.1 response regulator [Labilithrix sp.]